MLLDRNFEELARVALMSKKDFKHHKRFLGEIVASHNAVGVATNTNGDEDDTDDDGEDDAGDGGEDDAVDRNHDDAVDDKHDAAGNITNTSTDKATDAPANNKVQDEVYSQRPPIAGPQSPSGTPQAAPCTLSPTTASSNQAT